jgi:hypothetical protein
MQKITVLDGTKTPLSVSFCLGTLDELEIVKLSLSPWETPSYQLRSQGSVQEMQSKNECNPLLLYKEKGNYHMRESLCTRTMTGASATYQ